MSEEEERIPEPTDITLTKEEVADLQSSFKRIALIHYSANQLGFLGAMLYRAELEEHTSKILNFLGVKVGVFAADGNGVDVGTQLREADKKRKQDPQTAATELDIDVLGPDERNDPDRK